MYIHIYTLGKRYISSLQHNELCFFAICIPNAITIDGICDPIWI